MLHICGGTHGKTCLKQSDIGKYSRDVAVVSLVPYDFSSQCSSHLSGVKTHKNPTVLPAEKEDTARRSGLVYIDMLRHLGLYLDDIQTPG